MEDQKVKKQQKQEERKAKKTWIEWGGGGRRPFFLRSLFFLNKTLFLLRLQCSVYASDKKKLRREGSLQKGRDYFPHLIVAYASFSCSKVDNILHQLTFSCLFLCYLNFFFGILPSELMYEILAASLLSSLLFFCIRFSFEYKIKANVKQAEFSSFRRNAIFLVAKR